MSDLILDVRGLHKSFRLSAKQLRSILEILLELDQALKSSPTDKAVLLQTAKRLGKTAVHGIGMLCGQAAVAQTIWGIAPCDREGLLRLSRVEEASE